MMKNLWTKGLAAAVLSALSAQVLAGSITIQELSTTDRDGDFPVCFNGAGELLPCAGDVVIPPVDAYTGLWSGRMVYDRFYTGDNTCYDADVKIRVDIDGEHTEISSITIERDVGGVGIYVPSYMRLSSDGYVADDFEIFGIYTDFSLRFNTKGNATGVWSDAIYSDCRGAWSITKD